jgi:hypothetical protein
MNSKRVWFFLLLLFPAVVFCQTKGEKKEREKIEQEKQYEATKILLDSGRFEFNADWATSFQGARVNLVTNPNYLKIDQDKASVYLPYLGVAHTSDNAFSSTGGFVFEGHLENYRILSNEKKKVLTITFRCRAQSEILDFNLKVYANGNARLNVNSSTRTSVKYDGKITALASGESSSSE